MSAERRPSPRVPPTVVELLDDDDLARRVQRGELVKLDPIRPTPADAAAVQRLREQMARCRGARPVRYRDRQRDDDGRGGAA
jgi:hypothetical protein